MLLQKGTRVVLRVAIPAAKDVLPPGTVAEVVGTPPDSAGALRLRFANGHEASVARSAFMPLSQVTSDVLSDMPARFEKPALRKHIIYQAVVGSRAFGLETESSDTDRRGIYQAPTDLVLSLYNPPEQLENDAAQECFWELKKFLVLALKANPSILEVLYSPIVEIATPTAEALLEIRSAFLSRLVYQTYGGYVISQFKKLVRSRERKDQPNWKNAVHLLRLLESGTTLLEQGEPELRTAHRDKLLEIRAGQWEWRHVEDWRTQLQEAFERAYRSTSLPERPNHALVNDFLVRARRGEFAGNR